MRILIASTTLILMAGVLSCLNIRPAGTSGKEPPASRAQMIVDKAIAAHGGQLYDRLRLQFTFRDRSYTALRQNGSFRYTRSFADTTGRQVEDVLTNEGFQRFVEGKLQPPDHKKDSAYTNSVNSVIYFVLLPYFLNDPAVIKSYLGEEMINGQPYHKIKVTFRREGGGRDYEDEFIYWFHRDRNTLDYLAYNYLVDGGGARFRQAYNSRTINGIRFTDYINFKPRKDTRAVSTFAELWQNGGLTELSRIETENIEVEILNEQ